MAKQPFRFLVFLGALLGALVGTLVVPGLGTAIGVVVGGLVGLVFSHRRKAKVVEPPPRM